MQLQIECNPVPNQKQLCLTCSQLFKTTEARVILYGRQDKKYGDVCPTCLSKGFHWLNQRFEQLVKPQTKFQNKVLSQLQIKGAIPQSKPRIQPLALPADA